MPTYSISPSRASPSGLRQALRGALSRTLPRHLFMTCGPVDTQAACLTFDDGPHPQHTPRLLDILNNCEVQATFFVVGKHAQQHPQLIERICREGHSIGHHSFTHSDPSTTSAETLVAEINQTAGILQNQLGSSPRLFRPPHGKITTTKMLRLWHMGQTIVLWNRDPKDFECKSAAELSDRLETNPIGARDIVLLHDTFPHAAQVLPQIIEGARRRGVPSKSRPMALMTSLAEIPDVPLVDADALRDTHSRRLIGQAIVCFAKDWSEHPTSNNHVMTELAKCNRVLWLNSIATRAPSLTRSRDLRKVFRKLASFFRGVRRVQRDLWVYSPIVIPFPHSRLATVLNRGILRLTLRWLRYRLKLREFQLWTFLPNTADYVGELGESFSVYYCVDEWSQFNYLNGSKIAAAEEQLCRKVDVVFASAQSLVDRRKAWNAETHLSRHGVNHSLFKQALDPQTQIPADIACLPKPIIGFYGTLQDWVDQQLIAFLAEHRRNGRSSCSENSSSTCPALFDFQTFTCLVPNATKSFLRTARGFLQGLFRTFRISGLST